MRIACYHGVAAQTVKPMRGTPFGIRVDRESGRRGVFTAYGLVVCAGAMEDSGRRCRWTEWRSRRVWMELETGKSEIGEVVKIKPARGYDRPGL